MTMIASRYLTSVYLAVLCASGALAVPWDTTSKHATHRVRHVGRGLKVETFQLHSSYEVCSLRLSLVSVLTPNYTDLP
jgi:hypothetical protein